MKIVFSRTVYYLGKKLLLFEVELILHEFEVYFSNVASRLSYVDVCKFFNVCVGIQHTREINCYLFCFLHAVGRTTVLPFYLVVKFIDVT